jgi:histidine triad (HIT) family protein
MTYLELVEKNDLSVLYKDEVVAVLIEKHPIVKGQLTILPVTPRKILEELSDEELARLFITANKLSIVLFEKLKCEGTNFIIRNGTSAGQTEPQFSIALIPRFENDGLGLEWKPRKGKDLDIDAKLLSSALNNVKEETEKVEPVEKEGSNEYLINSLKRVP